MFFIPIFRKGLKIPFMYILQNALKNLMRNKGRNILMGAIIFTIILTTVIALIINNTSAAVIDRYRDSFYSEVQMTPDVEKMREEAMSNATGGRVSLRMPQMDPELSLSFAQSEYLDHAVATGSVSADSKNTAAIDHVDADEDEQPSDGGAAFSGGDGGGNFFVQRAIGGMGGDFRLYGDDWADFDAGTKLFLDENITYPLENDGECFISQELAALNNIRVGQSITLTADLRMSIPESEDLTGKEYGDTVNIDGNIYVLADGGPEGVIGTRTVIFDLKVAGMYTDLEDPYPNPNMQGMAQLNGRNAVYTTLSTILSQRKSGETGIMISARYFLKDPADIGAFEREVRAKGLPDEYLVQVNAAGYERTVKPVVNLKTISLVFLFVVLILGGIILVLISFISIRERKYEIGVLRTMGMKKGKVALGLWYEVVAITAVCLVLGLGTGAVLSQPIANKVLESQAQSAQEDEGPMMYGREMPMGAMRVDSRGGMMIGGQASNAQPIDSMQIALDWVTLVEIICISLLLATLAALISISRITQSEPIKILMDRN